MKVEADPFRHATFGWDRMAALNGAVPGSTLIESSTLTVPRIQELAALAAGKGCNFVDAPVTGTKRHAESGELLFLVGRLRLGAR